MPATARSLGVNPDDPNQALQGAARLMSRYLKQYGGDWTKALTAYNAGPGAVGHSLPSETQSYVSSILGGRGSGGMPRLGDLTPQSAPAPATFKTVTDPEARGRVALAQYLMKTRPDSPLLRLGIVSASEPTTQRVRVPGTPSASPPVSGQGQQPSGARPVMFDGKPVAPWIAANLRWAKAHGWQGTVTSGYRSAADQARIARQGAGGNPVAAPGKSNHQFLAFPGGAVDVTAAAQLAQILARKPGGSKLRWAGSKDPVHFSFPHNGGY